MSKINLLHDGIPLKPEHVLANALGRVESGESVSVIVLELDGEGVINFGWSEMKKSNLAWCLVGFQAAVHRHMFEGETE